MIDTDFAELSDTNALADLTQVSQVMENCQRMGVKFALDDTDDLAILQGVIALAMACKRKVIAEGVETVAHGTALLQLGCQLAQGYGIARPMPAADLPAWAATWQPHVAWRVQAVPEEVRCA